MKTRERLLSEIEAAAKRAGRKPSAIRLIAVGKGQPIGKIEKAFFAGQRDFGENYVQEWMEKQKACGHKPICWHFIGHLQKNKINKVVDGIEWLHTLDSLDLAKGIQKRVVQPLKCLIEINFGNEKNKSGILAKKAKPLMEGIKKMEKIDLRGLMTIPPPTPDAEGARPYFRELFKLLKEWQSRYALGDSFKELSMGMSGDFETAVEEGATMVRIGEAFFGKR